jgi:deoxycytidylate deaminase
MRVKTCKNNQEFFLRYAANIATYSNVLHNRHGCVIVQNGEIIAEGYNHYVKHFEHAFSMHAEVHAISKLKKKILNNECELYVVRIGTSGMGHPLKYSKPCENCTNAIVKSGIRKIYYSTNDDFEDKHKQIYKKSSGSQYSSVSSGSQYSSE